jgi:hypothetical protein
MFSRRWFGRTNRKPIATRRRPSFQPCVEVLEYRLTPANVPMPTDPTVMSITSISAVLGGTITAENNGGLGIQVRGVVYSTTASTDADLQIGKPNVTEVDAPPYLSYGPFTVTVGPLTPNTTYYFRAFATNGTLPANNDFKTGYTPIVLTGDNKTVFTTNPGNAQDNRILMPTDTVAHKNDVLFFQPTPGQEWTRPDGTKFTLPHIPDKQITFTNNLSTTVYPFMRDANSTVDERASGQNPQFFQGLYDPIDQMNEEYRGYIGYTLNGKNYLGLLPGMSITVDVPLVFWDGARCEIATDGTYLVNNFKVQAQGDQANAAPNPFQYYDINPDKSATAHVALPAVSIGGAPAGVTQGMVMWYRQGLNNQTDKTKEPAEQAHAPVGDAPSQLIEWTIRDPVLSTINRNIDILKPNFGETHALINYDVSYVDNMALPVAMEALDVPIPVTNPPQPVQKPYPGPRLPYGWVGAALTLPDFQAAMNNILNTGLGQYFGGKGWPQYLFPSNLFPGGTPLKIPSGQAALSDSPLVDHRTSYDAPIVNHYLLTSGGTAPINLVGAGGAYTDGTTTLRLVANTLSLQQTIKLELTTGMVVTKSAASQGPDVPTGTTILSWGPNGNNQFTFIPYKGDMVLEVQLSNSIPASGGGSFPNPTYGYDLRRPTTDYASTALINLWYTWAKYYVDHVQSTEYPNGLDGKSMTTDNGKKDNVIHLTSPASGLVAGMLVSGDASTGIFQLRPDGSGATTILSIDPDNQTIHLSQAVGVGSGLYKFTKPAMNSPAMAGVGQAQIIDPADFTPADNQTPGVPHALDFARDTYLLLSLMSQIPTENVRAVDILHNVIGGNIRKDGLNADAFSHTEVAYRDKIKSLLRGVNDFTAQTDQVNQWYPDPTKAVGNPNFNIYNLDPFVWLVHKKMGLSGYGFSLDDDAADIGANYADKLGVSIGGLNGLPNQVEYSETAPYGPVSATAKVLSLGADTLQPPGITFPYEISGLPKFKDSTKWPHGSPVWYSVKALDTQNSVPGAQVSGAGVSPGTFLLSGGDAAQTNFSFALGPVVSKPTYSDGSNTLYIVADTPLLQGFLKTVLQKGMVVTVSGSGAPNVPEGTTVQTIGPAGNPGFNFTQYTPQGGVATTVLQVGLNNPISSSGNASFVFTFALPVPPLTSKVGSTTQYTFYYGGTPNTSPLTLGSGETDNISPYTNTSTLTIPVGSTLKITGNLTSYTQQVQQFTRVIGETLPKLCTVVNGTLDVSRVNVVNGTLAGTGTITGAVSLFAPLSATQQLHETPGGLLLPASSAHTSSAKPGKLSTGDVTMYGSKFGVIAKGATTAGTDYSQLVSSGKVNLGNSNLVLYRDINYIPKAGDTLTILTAANGITGKFKQGDSVVDTTGAFRFTIEYNANSVVLKYEPLPF